jgi:hypothetical protein
MREVVTLSEEQQGTLYITRQATITTNLQRTIQITQLKISVLTNIIRNTRSDDNFLDGGPAKSNYWLITYFGWMGFTSNASSTNFLEWSNELKAHLNLMFRWREYCHFICPVLSTSTTPRQQRTSGRTQDGTYKRTVFPPSKHQVY